MSLKEIFRLVLSWRLVLLAIAIPAIFLVSPHTRYTNLTETPNISNILVSWSNFDGLHYLDLAQYGYGYMHKTDMDYVFFPVYPWLIKTFSFLGGYLSSGLLISHLALILALYYLYKLVNLDFSKKISKQTIYLLLLFPTSFFFGSVYTESVFLLLAILCFYTARKGNFFLAGVLGLIASITRVTGIFLWPALIYEFWLQHGSQIKKVMNPSVIWLALPPLGILSFLRYQFQKTGDPLFFIHSQTNYGGRTIEKLVLLHQVFFRYFKMLIFVDHMDPLFFTVLLEFLSAVILVLVLIFSIKKIRFSYWIFVLLSFLLPTFTGTFMSMPRFIMVLFPTFIFLADWLENHHPYFKYLYYFLCIVLGIFSIVLFTRGYFIA